MKYKKAKEWQIPVVNVRWLSDLILGQMDALKLPIAEKYKTVTKGDEFQMDLIKVQHLLGEDLGFLSKFYQVFFK